MLKKPIPATKSCQKVVWDGHKPICKALFPYEDLWADVIKIVVASYRIKVPLEQDRKKRRQKEIQSVLHKEIYIILISHRHLLLTIMKENWKIHFIKIVVTIL